MKHPLLLPALLVLLPAACGNPDHSDPPPPEGQHDAGLGGAGGSGNVPCEPPKPECLFDADCSQLDPDLYGMCGGKPVCVEGECTYTFKSDITPLDDIKGNCADFVCSDGDVFVSYNPDDPEDDGNPCRLDVCVGIYETWHSWSIEGIADTTQGASCVTSEGQPGFCNCGLGEGSPAAPLGASRPHGAKA